MAGIRTNGWQIRVYDVHTLGNFDDVLLVLNQGDDEKAFTSLRDMIGAQSMRKFQRKRMLDVIKGTLEAEVDEAAVNDLAQQVHGLISDGRQTVKSNADELWMAAMRDRFAEEDRELRSAALNILFVRMDNPGDGRPISARELSRRVVEASADEQARLIDQIAMHYRGRPHNIFRVLALHALIEIAKAGVSVQPSHYVKSVVGCVNELAWANICYWSGSIVCGPLSHLDNVACRVAMKLCVRVGSEHFQHILSAWKESLTPEELAALRPSVEGIAASSASHIHEIFWRWFCSGRSADEIWRGVWDLHAIEAELDKLPPGPSAREIDFYGVQFMGLSWDQLRVGTWSVLRERPGLGSLLEIDSRVHDFAAKSREEVLTEMPPELKAPEGYAPGKTMKDALSALAAALNLRVLATLGEQIAKGTGKRVGP